MSLRNKAIKSLFAAISIFYSVSWLGGLLVSIFLLFNKVTREFARTHLSSFNDPSKLFAAYERSWLPVRADFTGIFSAVGYVLAMLNRSISRVVLGMILLFKRRWTNPVINIIALVYSVLGVELALY